MRPHHTVFLAGCLVLGATEAHAEETANRGTRLFAKKKYKQAITVLKKARSLAENAGYDFSCEIGLSFAGLGDHARAHLYLGLCARSTKSSAFAKRAGDARDAAEKALAAGEFAPLRIEVTPKSAVAYVSPFEDVTFKTPNVVWLPIGSHTIGARAEGLYEAARQVIIYGRDPETVTLDLERITKRARNRVTTVDFGEEETPHEETTSDDLPDAEHETLMPKRYRRGGVSTQVAGRPPSRLAIGVKAGLSVSRLGGKGAPAGGSRVGAAAAAFLSYTITARLALQPELGFAMRGGENAAIDYLTVPLLAVYRIATWPVGVELELGPEIAIALTDDLHGQDVTPFDIALVAGAAAHIPVASGSLAIGLRAAVGFTTVDGTTPSSEAYNRTAVLLVGYVF